MTPQFLLRAAATVTIIGLLTVIPVAHPDTDPASEPVLTDIDQPAPPERSLLFNTHQWTNFVEIYDGSTLALLSSVPVGTYCGAVALSRDKQKAYVGCWGQNRVSELDVTNPAAPVVVRSFSAGRMPTVLAASPDGRKVFAINRRDGDLTVIHLDQAGATTRLALPAHPSYIALYAIAISPDSRTAYVAGGHVLHVIDVASLSVTSTIGLGTRDGVSVGQMAVTADNRTLVVADSNAGVLLKVDAVTYQYSYVYGASQHGHGLAVTSDGTRAYMTHSNTGGLVSIFDLTNLRLLDHVRNLSGIYPLYARLSDDGGCLFVRSQFWIDIVRTSDHSRIARISVGDGPGGLETNGVPSSLCAVRRPAVLSWTPSDLIYGDPVGAAQLNATSDVAGTFEYSPAAGALLAAGTHTLSVTFTPTDATKYFSVTREAVVTVTPASLTVTGPTLSREFGTDNPPLGATATGFVNGDDVSDLSGALSVSTTAILASPVGSYPVFVSGVTSSNYEIAFVAGRLTVVDTTAPVISSVTPSEATLWAPNHRMVPITLSVTVTDATGVSGCRVVSVSSNERVTGTGTGDTSPDWAVTGDLQVDLRAERAGSGLGRVYTIVVECRDAYGNTAAASTTVGVPHSRGRG